MRKVALLLSVIFVVLTVDSANAGEVKMRSLRFWNEAGHIRFVIDLSAKAGREIFLLDRPGRVVIDLKNTRLATRFKQPDSSHPMLQRIRHATRNKRDLRVVLDLKKKVRVESVSLDSDRNHGHRLVLDLFDPGSSKVAGATPSNQSVRPPAANPLTPAAGLRFPSQETPTQRVSLAAHSIEFETRGGKYSRNTVNSGSVTRTAKPRNPVNPFVVAIDAGHGGNDPGARGALGTWEKDVVLSIAKKLHRLIAREPGMRAVLIRNGDYFIPLRQRIRLARTARADIFVSIHADAFRRSNIRGSSVYTLSEHGASSEAARWLAAKENASDLIGGVSLEDKDQMLARVLLDLSQTATMDASTDLATRVLRNLRHLGKTHKRMVQSAGFAVLKSPDIPSILVETAFISNPAEEKNLKNSAYQDKLARAVLGGIRDYYRLRAAPMMNMAARKHVIVPGETLSEIAQRYGVSTRRLQAANTLNSTEIKAGQILEIPTGS